MDAIVVCNENLPMAMESLWDTSDPKCGTHLIPNWPMVTSSEVLYLCLFSGFGEKGGCGGIIKWSGARGDLPIAEVFTYSLLWSSTLQ